MLNGKKSRIFIQWAKRNGRAEMLKKEIKVSDSKKQIEEIFAAEVLENVKKGWEKV